jgi:hypothetical protein
MYARLARWLFLHETFCPRPRCHFSICPLLSWTEDMLPFFARRWYCQPGWELQSGRTSLTLTFQKWRLVVLEEERPRLQRWRVWATNEPGTRRYTYIIISWQSYPSEKTRFLYFPLIVIQWLSVTPRHRHRFVPMISLIVSGSIVWNLRLHRGNDLNITDSEGAGHTTSACVCDATLSSYVL